ncbi:MAG: ABC transporter ATP-binding protein [Alphaproteobacteria bacterium]|nr:ABC transporter ATP-binding protein [Alphaproteobacteria bacterium]|tara:strand:+ start:2115 stop:2906 length:792 start_codon:yes stop_codon:yes gene_type:complete
MTTILEVEELSLAFGGVNALDKISLSVTTGSITSIIGPNGAGKTSLLNTISGFYKPQSGKILFNGNNITAKPPPKRAALGVARTFQNIALFRGMTALDNIKLGHHVHMKTGLLAAGLYFGWAQKEEIILRKKIESEIIDFLEIDHIRNVPVAALPYGLQKRVELARALAMDPSIILLDEPVAGMNREETEDMARFILDLREERGITILLVEHDMDVVMDISDHVIVLNFGRKIGSGTPNQVRKIPEVVEAYLGTATPAELGKE